jgi:cell wall assembly regulator SMI1
MPPEATSSPLLTFELLGEYETRLKGMGVPIKDVFAPGLSEPEMAAAVAALPLELSLEARVWWGWHNGILDGEGLYRGLIAPGTYLRSLEQAIRDHDENRALAEERDPENGDLWWDPAWMPILSPDNGTTIGCDCSVAEGEPSPLHVVWWENPDDPGPRQAAQSLGQMVVWWLDAVDSGIWRYDPTEGRWRRDWAAVPAERNGLV